MKLLKALQEIDETAAIVVLVDRMLELQPENSDVLESAAYAHAAEGDTEQALDLYARILQNDKTHVLALEGSGFIYQWLQEWREAIPYYLELLKVSPEEDHYHALARCYAQLGKESKSVIFLGQAASLYGEGQVSPWLREADFDDVRETVDFRALTDRIVGIETRKAIENIRRREIAKPVPEEIEDFKLQMKPELDILKPRR
jgi:tetratricopeptide (TPR) repeat protein